MHTFAKEGDFIYPRFTTWHFCGFIYPLFTTNNVKKMAKYATTFGARSYDKISVRMVLDTKHRADSNGCRLVVVRIIKEGRSLYVSANERFTEKDFEDICQAEANNTKKYKDVRKRLGGVFDRVCGKVKELVDDDDFTFENFKRKYYNLIDPNETTIYSLWRDVAADRSAGTEDSYLNALNRFIADMGKKVIFQDVDAKFIGTWKDRMTDAGLSKTTANIYLRALRVVLNAAIEQGYVKSDTKTLFKKMQIGGKNSFNSRKHEYLDVQAWRKLWAFYQSVGEGNEVYAAWRSDYKRNNMEALGLMLFMYLGAGFNLADLLRLRYDDFYFSHGKEMFRFQRKKVAGRTDAEVVFPILPEMRVILDRQGEKEERSGLVFGYLKDKLGRIDEREERRLCALINSTIRARMKNVAKAVGLKVEPSPTWCRHSFATNLIQAGVPKDYVSASMAHSSGSSDITDNYIERYSREQMVEYNSRLLANPAERDKERLKALLRGMSAEQINELLK